MVRLSGDEMYQGAIVGLRRQLRAVVKGSKPRFPERYPGELFAYHIIGAMAEVAVAKYLGVYWSAHTGKFSCGDVGEFEVRWSMRSDLKVRPRDSGIIVSVTGQPPEFKVVGWISADRARRLVGLTSPAKGKPAYFVPHEMLEPPEILREMIG
jgi:hypothetical protein